MSIFTSAIILLLVMLIQAFLQLTPGVFAIFYHHTRGKFSTRRADDLSLHFYLGVEIFTAIIFLALFAIISLLFNLFPHFMFQIFPFCLAGVAFATSVLLFLCYFRRRGLLSTALFISRTHAAQLTYRADHAKSRTDAFLLGALAPLFELGFSIPLYLLCIYIALSAPAFEARWVVICYILATLAPLFFIHAFYKSGHTLAALQRFRVRSKPFLRFLLTLGYLGLAIAIIIYGVHQNGF